MANVPTFSPNPFGNFDPSQWSNPDSSYQSGALPFPYSQLPSQSGYVGWPTDAMGNPIQAPPGMTLNSAPQQAAPQQAAPQNQNQAAMNMMLTQNAVDQMRGQAIQQRDAGGFGNTYTGLGGMQGAADLLTSLQQQRAALAPQAKANGQAILQALASGNYGALGAITGAGGGQASAAPAGGGAPANSSGLNAQQYLSLLANPGKPPTYGATVPQAPSNQQSGVLQSFLKGWTPASSGPGSGFQQGFSKALKGMGY